MTVANAGSGMETAGDVLLCLIPAAAVALTVYYKDGKGALLFGESAALTLGVTQGLKYSVEERRPNGGRHSFPSGHSSIFFSAFLPDSLNRMSSYPALGRDDLSVRENA